MRDDDDDEEEEEYDACETRGRYVYPSVFVPSSSARRASASGVHLSARDLKSDARAGEGRYTKRKDGRSACVCVGASKREAIRS